MADPWHFLLIEKREGRGKKGREGGRDFIVANLEALTELWITSIPLLAMSALIALGAP